MAKGPIVTDAVEALIGAVYRKHPKWKAPMVREEVSYLLRKDNPELPPSWPSLSTVQKVLATVRRKANELPDDPEEKPWSMATLVDYPISPEAIPAVLKVWKFRTEKGDTFTIHEAKWASRLWGLLEDIEKLSAKARQYARTELLFKLIGRPFDSAELDRSLMGLPVPINSDLKSFLWLLADKDDKEVALSIKRLTEGGIKDGVEQIKAVKIYAEVLPDEPTPSETPPKGGKVK
jgi:hypothetical protein